MTAYGGWERRAARGVMSGEYVRVRGRVLLLLKAQLTSESEANLKT